MWQWVILTLTVIVLILVINRSTSLFQAEIPKIIWTYWAEEDLPDMIQKCIESWRKYNPDYEIRILNKNSVNTWVPDLDLKSLKMNDGPARESDFVRLSILPIYGGIWADASIRMNRSMDYIRDIQQEKGCEVVGYYLDSFTSKPEYPVIESWFFGCIPNSSFMVNWRDEFFKINTHNSPGDYVDAKRREGVDLQTIKWLEYLAIHVAAQTVMQTRMTAQEVSQKLHLMKAEDGPLNHVPKNDGDLTKSLREICEKGTSSPFVKLRHTDRNVIKENKNLECVYNNF
jgi:hypothetical protein